jgi:predicted dehydrogenase
MKNIVIIGAGQLGSRHLQALSKVNYPARITVIDPFSSSLRLAQDRFNEMPVNPNIPEVYYHSLLNDLTTEIDLAILATNADVRAYVIRALVSRCEVKNLVLEKVLFQKIEDYADILSLLENKGVKAWVNHPRRLFPFYIKLKQLMETCSRVSFQVQGGGWGLACNGLHLIDLLWFLTGGGEVKVDTYRLDQSVLPSKRPGFLEVTGTLAGRIGSHSFTLFCHEAPSPLVITICSDSLIAIIDEGNGWARMSRKENGWKWAEEKQKIVYLQSELSNKVTEDIFTLGHCDLPTLADATGLHVPFIRGLLDHINRYGGEKHTLCPVT